MKPFTYNSLPARVIFGSGTIATLGEEIKRLGCSRALILSTPQQQADAKALADRIGPLAAGLYANATMHTPVAVTEEALAVARNLNADVTVALGGGSTTGLGKAIALRTDLPQIVIPTTYAGSEATPILGETKDGLKTTQRSPKVLPEVILYDVDLTLSLPPGLSATSGMNAIAHAVEALYAQDANPITSLMARRSDPRPGDRAARDRQGSRQQGSAVGRALWRLALRHLPGHGGHGAASQALPHLGRHLRSSPCRNPYGRPAACHRLQCIRRAGGDETPGARPECGRSGARTLRSGTETGRADVA